MFRYRLTNFRTWIKASNLKLTNGLSMRKVFIFCWISFHKRVEPASNFSTRDIWLDSGFSAVITKTSMNQFLITINPVWFLFDSIVENHQKISVFLWVFIVTTRNLGFLTWLLILAQWSFVRLDRFGFEWISTHYEQHVVCPSEKLLPEIHRTFRKGFRSEGIFWSRWKIWWMKSSFSKNKFRI